MLRSGTSLTDHRLYLAEILDNGRLGLETLARTCSGYRSCAGRHDGSGSIWQLPVETIGTKFGGIPQSLPSFEVPEISWLSIKQLIGPAMTLAILGAIESLLCARVADAMTDERHDPNQELMGQGVANCVVPFFGGLPATGTIARTVTNIKSGARNTGFRNDPQYHSADHCFSRSTFGRKRSTQLLGGHPYLHGLQYG